MKILSQFSKNYLPILFNLFTSDDIALKPISLVIMEAIRAFLLITENEVSFSFPGKVLMKFNTCFLIIDDENQDFVVVEKMF